MLVDSSNINQLVEMLGSSMRSKDRLESVGKKEVNRLDSKMLDIVNDDTLSDEEKVFKYNQTLAQFQNIINLSSPREPPIKSIAKLLIGGSRGEDKLIIFWN